MATDEPTTAAGRALLAREDDPDICIDPTHPYAAIADEAEEHVTPRSLILDIEAEARREGAAEALAAVEPYVALMEANGWDALSDTRGYIVGNLRAVLREAERKKAAETA